MIKDKLNQQKILKANKDNYEDLYNKEEAFLRYPADWIIRFHNMYLKKNLPKGKVLDYGCGSGNNSIFFMEKGYKVWGVDVSKPFLKLLKINFKDKKIDLSKTKQFMLISPDSFSLPYKDNFFDLIVSNQVLYYLPSEEHIRKILKELKRCLRPGGIVFFTMMGPKNYYIQRKVKKIHHKKIYEIAIEDKKHRLYGLREFIYLVKTEDELRDLFSDFKPITTGYFDQSMFDVTSNFHWIFVGEK